MTRLVNVEAKTFPLIFFVKQKMWSEKEMSTIQNIVSELDGLYRKLNLNLR